MSLLCFKIDAALWDRARMDIKLIFVITFTPRKGGNVQLVSRYVSAGSQWHDKNAVRCAKK